MLSIRPRFVAVVLLTMLTTATAAISGPAQANDPRITPLVLAVEACQESVVNIHTEKNGVKDTDSRFFTPKVHRISGMGTGIVVDERGYIVTNYHVIHEVDEITVTLKNGETLKARAVSFDRKQDMAIIHVNASAPLTVMQMGTSSDVRLAEQVFAVGNAFGYEHTVTAGIVSALSRDVEVDETQSYENLIQTDASINPGNSGGPLLNVKGEVIGVNVAIRAGAQRIGFAIPIDDARVTVARLLSTERLNRVSHGLFGSDVKTPAEQKLVVDSVISGSAADLSGIRKGDTVKSVRDVEVHDAADWERGLLDIPVGQVMDVQVERAGELVDLRFTVGVGQTAVAQAPVARSTGAPVKTVASVASAPPTAKLSIRDKAQFLFGLHLINLNAHESNLLKGKYNGGLRVQKVTRDSIADRHGIRPGDLLLGLDLYETVDDHNLAFILEDKRLQSLNEVKFTIYRNTEALEGTMPVPSVK